MPNPSQRAQTIQSPFIPIVGQLIRENPGTISLGQGVVYYDPPPASHHKIEEFFQQPQLNKYQSVKGIPELVELAEQKVREENGIPVNDAQRLIVTAGGNMAFTNTILAIADPGDEIILSIPYYFNHEMAITMASCKTVCVPTDENYQIVPEALEAAITPKTKAIVTVSPNNPTGAVYPEATIRKVNQICREHGIYHISDEPYEYFTYDGARHFSAGSIEGSEPYTISLFSLSKAYGFASWRIGYMVIPAHLFEPMRKIQDTILICPPVISQFAAAGALAEGKDYCTHHLTTIRESREIFMEELDAIRDICEVPPTQGAFYFLLRLQTDMPDTDLMRALVKEHKVAVLPGSTFGLEKGCYLRIAYGATDASQAREGIQRLVKGLQAIIG